MPGLSADALARFAARTAAVGVTYAPLTARRGYGCANIMVGVSRWQWNRVMDRSPTRSFIDSSVAFERRRRAFADTPHERAFTSNLFSQADATVTAHHTRS